METFSTPEFSFDLEMVRLHRKRRIFNFSYDEIERVEIKNGTHLDHPSASIAFGLTMLIVCGLFIANAGFGPGEFFNSTIIIRILASLILVGGLGAHAIYSALPIHRVIEIAAADKSYRYLITSVIKKGRLGDLCELLKSRLGQKFIVSVSLQSGRS